MKHLVAFSIFLCGFIVVQAQPKDLSWFLQQARVNSPLIKDYRNQVLVNQLDSERIKATYRPQVNANSTNFYAPVIGGYGYDAAITNGGQLSALVGVNQQLVSRKYLGAQFETLNIQNQGLDNASKISEQDLGRTVIAQYITVYSDQEQLHFVTAVSNLLRPDALGQTGM